jgi:hypothetical protein
MAHHEPPETTGGCAAGAETAGAGCDEVAVADADGPGDGAGAVAVAVALAGGDEAVAVPEADPDALGPAAPEEDPGDWTAPPELRPSAAALASGGSFGTGGEVAATRVLVVDATLGEVAAGW